jgi:hypothetical protein
MDIVKLHEKAAALGCSIEPGAKRGAGYVLTDSNGQKPLGADYTAGLKDIEQYLDDLSDDDVETGKDTTAKPPGRKEMTKALAQHPERAKIKQIIDRPKPTEAELLAKRRREGTRDSGGSLFWTLGQHDAYWMRGYPGGMAPDDAARMEANARQARSEQEKIDAAAAPARRPQLFRITDQTKISVDDPLFAEKSRKRRVFQQADRLFYRTNVRSLADGTEGTPAQIRAAITEAFGDALPPDEGPSGASIAATGFIVQSKRQAAQRDHGGADADAVAAIRQGADDRRLAEAGPKIDAALAANDLGAAGAVLMQVKRIVGHGNFTPWLKNNGIEKRTAERWMKAAKLKSDTAGIKSDTGHAARARNAAK